MQQDFGECQGYVIQERVPIGTHIFSLGYCPQAPQPYVVWQSNIETPEDYYFGHYSQSKKAALRDLHSRITSDIEFVLERIDFMVTQTEKTAPKRSDIQIGDSR